ncbi:OTU domain-containing protein [Pyxidicoccus caerfyrddinensis]|uniref:OTU domain-containing protein n=1 Tax=Pyxidicoccus caerfyrddinensis TaxID=2709663 RepID=UPI0013D9D2EA|nr:hypothetical protein [Pyxidicoccus caerfyrddinensis]
MSCPHIEDGVVARVCVVCEDLFCAECFPSHSHDEEEEEAPVTAFHELTAAQRGDDEYVMTEEERAEVQAYILELQQAAASEEAPVSNALMAEVTLQSLQQLESVEPPPLPVVELPLAQGGGVQTVALNAVTTLAKLAPSPREYPFRCLLWNVANLGGKFGYPKVRDDSVIDATARIIHQADADVVSILELLGSGSGEKEPKPPVKPNARAPRGALLIKLLAAFGLGDSGEQAEQVEQLKTLLGRYFSEKVHGAIWPGADPDVTALLEEAKAIKEVEAGETLATLMDEAWTNVCAPHLAALAPKAGDVADADTLAEAVIQAPKNGVEDEDEDDSGSKSKKRKRKGGSDGRREHLKLAQHAAMLRDGIQLLSVEGYTHWLERFTANYAKNDGADGVSVEDGKARDNACKKVLGLLSLGGMSLYVQFLRGLVGTEVTEEMIEAWGKAQGPRASYENTLWPGCWSLLLHANEKAMTADYERRLARWKKRHGAADGKATKHDGIREFLRIRDALNALSGDAYDSWPAKLPEDTDKSLYTERETYGLLWKKATVAPDLDNVGFISAFASEFEFSKRQPLRFPFQLKKAASGPAIVLVPWHAPAPSATNATARSKDFPAFVRYCEAERKAKRLGMLLSDLNVNTVSGSTSVEHCDGTLEVGALFRGISGKADAYRQFPAQVGTQSTLAVSKFRPWLIPDLLEQEDPSAKKAKDLVNKLQSNFVEGHFKTSQGLLDFIQGFNKDFTPQHRMSASAYDKILPICGRADRWKLGFKSTWAIPFPHALALEEEAEFFRAREQLSEALKPFAFLLATHAKETLKDLRAYAEQPGKAKKLEELMLLARELSDHLPIVAEVRLIDTEAAEEEAVAEAPIELFSVKPTALDELEGWAFAYEHAEVPLAREKALEDLVGWWNKTYETAAPSEAAQRRFQRALQKWDSAEARKAQNDDDKRQASRPALTKTEAARKKEVKTLGVHFAESHLRTRENGGGGDCLFRSIAQLVFGDENRHIEVRQSSVNHLEDLLAGQSLDADGRVGPVSREEFATRLGLLHDWHRVQWPNVLAYRRVLGVDRWRQFCLGMSRGGEWGDLLILCAASHLFGVRFRVYVQVAGGYYSDEVDFVNRALPARPELVLVNYGNYHFVAVTPAGREALIDVAVGTPVGWEALRVRRDRAPPVAPQEPAPQPKPEPAKTPPSSSGPSGSGLKPSGRVFKWPSTTPWSLADATGAPGCLFLFGENGVNKGGRMVQSTTQACIRPAPNAVGIRTCWKPGADENDQGAMLDTELAKNQKALDDDLEEALAWLHTGRYTTLVVPWDTVSDLPALGIGVAKLPQRAKNTYAHLCKGTAKLMEWAERSLGTVVVCPRETGLTDKICKDDPESLFIHESNCGLEAEAALRWWALFDTVAQQPNVVCVRTGHHDYFRIQDAKLAENTRLLGLDFDTLENAVRSGRFRRIVIPENGWALGVAAKLQSSAPDTHAYVQKRLKQLIDLCAATPSPLRGPPMPVSQPVAKPPTVPARQAEDADDSWREDSDGRATKVQRNQQEHDVTSTLPKAKEEAVVVVHPLPLEQPPPEPLPPEPLPLEQPPQQEDAPNPFKRRKTEPDAD